MKLAKVDPIFEKQEDNEVLGPFPVEVWSIIMSDIEFSHGTWNNYMLVSKKFHDLILQFSNISNFNRIAVFPLVGFTTNLIRVHDLELIMKNKSMKSKQNIILLFEYACWYGMQTVTNNKLTNKSGSDDGYFNIAKTLLDKYYGYIDTDIFIHLSCKKGYLEVLEFILSQPNIDLDICSDSILTAIKRKHYNIVELLLKFKVDPSKNKNRLIKIASKLGLTNIVVLLLKDNRVNPAANNNSAIYKATKNGHYEVVKALLQSPRVASTVDFEKLVLNASVANSKIAKLILEDPRADTPAIKEAAKRGAKEFSCLFD